MNDYYGCLHFALIIRAIVVVVIMIILISMMVVLMIFDNDKDYNDL